MREDLKSDLQAVSEVGDVRAEEILSILEEHGIPVDRWPQVRSDAITVCEYVTDSDHPSHGEKFARRVLDQLDG